MYLYKQDLNSLRNCKSILVFAFLDLPKHWVYSEVIVAKFIHPKHIGSFGIRPRQFPQLW